MSTKPQVIYVFTRDATQPGNLLVPLQVQARVAPDHLLLADGTSIPASFDLRSQLANDVLFVELDLAARSLSALPYTVPAGEVALSSSHADRVASRASWLEEGASQLDSAVKDVYRHISSNKVTAELAHSWAELGSVWTKDAVENAMPVQAVFVTFTHNYPAYSVHGDVPPFTHNIGLAGPKSGKSLSTQAQEDDGCGIAGLISPGRAMQLGLEATRPVRIEGITPEECVTTRLTQVAVTIAPGLSKVFDVAIYPPLRKKTNSDFLLGRPIVQFGRDNKVEGY
jgi:hypothetical protein